MADVNEIAVNNFRNYLRIPSVQPDIDYSECVTFLTNLAKEIGLTYNVYEFVAKKPVIVMSWLGSSPTLPSILLNSHMDVVPVTKDLWTHDPFAADIDEKGDIYGRGAQDMKSVAIQYLEAIRRLKQQNVKPKRTVHLSFVPDEEIGGGYGMQQFLQSQQFKDLNVGFALDEGMASANETFVAYNGERSIWEIKLDCNGQAGHGSLLLKNTPGEKLRVVIDKFMDRRKQEADKLDSNPNLTTGDVTTINLTMLEGGLEPNVVPSTLSVTFDIRLAVDVDHDEFEKEIQSWIDEAGGDIQINYIIKNSLVPATPIDSSNIYWTQMKKSFQELELEVSTATFPGGTDSNFIRKIGIPAIGFSPMNNTLVRLHDNDEFLNKDVFLKGVLIYMNLIPSVASA